MEIKEQIKLRFKGVDFPIVQLKATRQLEDEEQDNLNVEITPQVFIPDNTSNTFKIIINASISLEEFFNLNVVAIGSFELSKEDLSEEERRGFINANAIAIVFPYLRAFIANLTCNVGKVMKPIMLPIQFFKGEIELVNSEDDIKLLK